MAILNARTADRRVTRRRGWAVGIAGLCILLWSCFAQNTFAEDRTPTEYEVKSAFLFNFAKFTEWPAEILNSSNAPIRIGIIGNTPLASDLPSLVGNKKIEQHPVQIEVYDDIPSPPPHILFIAKSERGRSSRLLLKIRSQPVLTVSEVDGFCESGGMINFKLEGSERRKVRFEINNKAAGRHGLKLSSKLLGVAARLVETDYEP